MPDSSHPNDGASGGEPDELDALLRQGWETAGPAELSAAERAAAAHAQAKLQAQAFKRDGRRARRQTRIRNIRKAARPYAIPIVFAVLLIAALSWQFRPQAESSPIDEFELRPIRTIRVVQVLPKDAVRDPSTDAKIRATVNDMQTWFRSETGGREVNIKRDGGAIEIQTIQLAVDASLLEANPSISRTLQLELEANGVALAADEAFLAFVPIRPADLCGEAAVRTAAVFLKTCNPNERDYQTHPEIVAAHELLHLFGAVPDCAPNYRPGGHVSDPNDIMYEPRPSEPDRRQSPRLDPGKDDYFDHRRANCLDVAKLPIWVKPASTR